MRYLLVLLLLFLYGCSVRKISPEAAAFIPGDRDIYVYCSTKNIRDYNGNLVVVRDDSFWGADTPHIIYINDQECSELLPGEKLSIYLPAGVYSIGVNRKWSRQNYGAIVKKTITLWKHKVTVVNEGMYEDSLLRIQSQ